MNKTILITGGSRGIGKATVLEFLAEGWQVITTSTSGSCDYTNENLKVIKLDLTDSESIDNFVDTVKDERIDILINNAGIIADFNEKKLQKDLLLKTLNVNLIGLADLTESLMDHISSIKSVINISSSMGTFSDDIMDGWIPSYRISKAALNMYTRTLAASHKDAGINVCSYEPGWVKTDMGSEEAPRKPSEPANELYNLVNEGFETGRLYGPNGLRDW